MPVERTPAPDTATVMLLDSYGLIYRAFFALPVMNTSKGVPTNAAYGFLMMLLKLIADEKPTHVVAAFDKGLPAKRVAQYAEYKATRQETPDDLRAQFGLVRRILETFKIPIVEVDGEEADDVIATLARQAVEVEQKVDVVTGDLDLLQIVDDRTTVLVTRRGITDLGRYTPEAVRERFNLEPAQLPDYRGLKGDPSDNLPGIPGVGEKTASKLIRAAGSLDALVADPSLAGTEKLAKLVREFGAQAQVCRDVSVIARDLPVELPWNEAAFTMPPDTELLPLYRELEFKSLLAKLQLPKESAAIAVDEVIAGTYISFVHATDPPDFAKLATLLDEAAQAPRVALVLRPPAAVKGDTLLEASDEIGVSIAEGRGFAFLASALAQPRIGEAFARLLQSTNQLITHDAKGLFAALGAEPRNVDDDTMIAAHLLNPSKAYAKLADAVAEHLALSLPNDAAAWADACGRLAAVARGALAEREQTTLYETLELPLAHILAKMERVGIALDPAELSTLSREINADVVRLQREIYDFAGEEFNLGSPQQLGAILFEKLQIPGGKHNKTGWATGIEVLQGLAREYPICAKVLEYREVSKLKNTYVDVLPSLVDPNDRRLHTIFNQTTTATGRLSSTNPNLQNIPVRSELGRRVRRAFVAPSADRVLLAADYSQIELRLMAHLSGDEAMTRAFREGADIHAFTARQIFDVPAGEHETPNQRRIAKSVNFGLLYGMSDFGLAQRLEISRQEAREMTDAYFARFPAVRDYIRRSLEEGRENGYVSTLLGRRRYIPDLRAKNFALRGAAEREATNAPLQGSAADLMKLAMVRIDRALAERSLDAVLLLQIHDELIFEIARSGLDAVATLVKHEMESAMSLSVPLEATIKVGANWYELENFEAVEDEIEVGA